MNNTEIQERLIEIKEQMLELLDEAKNIIPQGMTKKRAEAYWYAHIKTAILKDHEYLGGSLVTMEHTINELEDDEEGENGDESND